MLTVYRTTVTPPVIPTYPTTPVTPVRPVTPVAPAATSKLNVFCSANTNETNAGQVVIWTAEVIGGNGTYTYSWTGAEDLSGDQAVIVKSYQTQGDKFAVVNVKSGSQNVSQACSTVISVGSSNIFGAAALFGADGLSWGSVGILIIILVILVICYVLYHRNNI
jgi:hypothetical protein